MGHKLAGIGNIRAFSWFDSVVERNVMGLCAVPFPETFLCPEQFSTLNVGTCFLLVFPNKTINCGFSDFYMTTRQGILAAIPIPLNQQLAITDKHTNGAKIADILVCFENPAFIYTLLPHKPFSQM